MPPAPKCKHKGCGVRRDPFTEDILGWSADGDFCGTHAEMRKLPLYAPAPKRQRTKRPKAPTKAAKLAKRTAGIQRLQDAGIPVFDVSETSNKAKVLRMQIAAYNKKGQANQPAPNIQKRIVMRARELQQAHFPESLKTTGSCLYATWAVITAAREHDVQLRLFAGSAKWRCMDDAHDDGVSAQWFAYQCDSGPHELQIGNTRLSGLSRANATRLIHNQMPEMHVWAGNGNVIVDITTGNWPAQTKLIINRPWLAPRPPDFWWDTAAMLPLGASYERNEDAMRTAIYLLNIP